MIIHKPFVPEVSVLLVIKAFPNDRAVKSGGKEKKQVEISSLDDYWVKIHVLREDADIRFRNFDLKISEWL